MQIKEFPNLYEELLLYILDTEFLFDIFSEATNSCSIILENLLNY